MSKAREIDLRNKLHTFAVTYDVSTRETRNDCIDTLLPSLDDYYREKYTKKMELVIEGYFEGQITYSNCGMRSQDEEEKFYLKKGDKVWIERKKR